MSVNKISVNQRQRVSDVGHNRLELLLFGLNTEQEYGINVFKVREVLPCPDLTGIPKQTTSLKGMAHIRGETIPVIDLSEAIGEEPVSPEERKSCFLVVTEYSRRTLSFLVRRVDRILATHWDNVTPPPVELVGQNYLTAVLEHDGNLIEILDVEQILADLIPSNTAVSEDIATEEVKNHAKEYHVMVVDDSNIALKQVQQVFEGMSIKVTTAKNGKAALTLLEQLVDKGVDVPSLFLMVVSDIEMPEMDGYTLVNRIRDNESLRKLHVVLHSSLSGRFNLSMIKKVGADAFIGKFDADELATAVVERMKAVESGL
ncbi:chemotaxis protein [Aliamphritea hakodatensis]|uniref:chemotaxis protein n=1 Tax=Aliamphritea hakodatensis TaxID=2895352 RepID=UPI0022FD694A|nr:chemotaxis protein [Aliamphritea hakodatensis]